MFGICKSTSQYGGLIPAGGHQIRIYEDTQQHHRHGSPYIGWAETVFLLEVDEIPTLTPKYGAMVANSPSWGHVWGSRYVDFDKSESDTGVKIEYYDNWRCWNGNTCRFELLIDNRHCVEPGPMYMDMYINPYTNTHYGKTMMGYCHRYDQYDRSSRYSKGSEWELATEGYLSSLRSQGPSATTDFRYEYLYETVAGSNWIRSPPTRHLWDWNSWQMASGIYWYRNDASGSQGTFDCNRDSSNRETGSFGVGCSSGGGDNWKAHISGSDYKNSGSAKFRLCYDYPHINIGGGCGSDCCEATVKVRRAGEYISTGSHRVTVMYMGASPYHNGGDPYLGWAYTVHPTWEVQEVRRAGHDRLWGMLSEGEESARRTVKSIVHHYDSTLRGEIGTHRFDFVKVDASLPLRISWYDNFRCTGGNTHCRWVVRIDGADCNTEASGTRRMLVNQYNHLGGYHGNMHLGMQAINICHGITAGTHTITFHNDNPGSWTGSPVLGWNWAWDAVGRGTTAHIELEEIGSILEFTGRLYLGSRIALGATPSLCAEIGPACGFRLVAQEAAGATQNLRFLGRAFGEAGDASFNIGPNTRSYDEVAIVWGTADMDNYVRFRTGTDIFENSVNGHINIWDVVTSDSEAQGWFNDNNGDHYFCRGAADSGTRPGGSSWGLTPYASKDYRGCGCNSDSWAGWGFFYSGTKHQCTACGCNGGGWMGKRVNSETKSGTLSGTKMQIWVRLVNASPANCDERGGCHTQVWCRSPASVSSAGSCYFSKVSKLTPYAGLWASKCRQGRFVGLEGKNSYIQQWLTLRCMAPIRVVLYAASRPGYDQATLGVYANLYDGISERTVRIQQVAPSRTGFERMTFDYTPQCTTGSARVALRLKNDSPLGERSIFVDRVSVEVRDNKLFDVPLGLGAGFYSVMRTKIEVDGIFGTDGAGMAPEGLVAYWKFNRDAKDSSGNRFDAVMLGSATFLDQGRFDECLLANDAATGDVYVSESGDTALDVTKVTMAAWIYPTARNNDGDIINKQNAYRMGISADGVLTAEFVGRCLSGGEVKIPYNAWSHVAVSYDGNQQNHFVNGKWVTNMVCSSGPDLQTNNENVHIGASYVGRIDDLMLFNRALSTSEVQFTMQLPELEDNEFTIGLTDGETTWAAKMTDRSTIDLATVRAANVRTMSDIFKDGSSLTFNYEHADIKEGAATGGYKLNLDYGSGSKMAFTAQTLNSWMPTVKQELVAAAERTPTAEGSDLRLVGYAGDRGRQRF